MINDMPVKVRYFPSNWQNQMIDSRANIFTYYDSVN